MDQIEVKRLDLKVGERFARSLFDMLSCVVCVPKLGGDPQLIARHQPVCNRAGNPFANLCLIGIVSRAIEMAIARLNRFVCDIGRILACDFPEAEADCRNGVQS